MAENTLYYGDNLDILQRYGKDELAEIVRLHDSSLPISGAGMPAT